MTGQPRKAMPEQLTHQGETLSPAEWAQKLGISEVAFRQRWNHHALAPDLFRKAGEPTAAGKAGPIKRPHDPFADEDYR